jgi:hypothetical protein
MTLPARIECRVDFRRRGHGARKELCSVVAESKTDTGRVPHIARLLALAIHFDRLLASGAVSDYSALARIGRVSRVMNLLLLAPGIQEQILFLPPSTRKRDAIPLARLHPIAREWDWQKQRRMWQALLQYHSASESPDSRLEVP